MGGRKRTGAKDATKVATGPAKRDPEQTRAIRDWANSNGYQVSSRGRIPGEIEEAYEAAH